MLGYIILFSIFGGIFSTIGGLFLLWKKGIMKRFSLFLMNFAVGVLLAVAFLDLIPEAIERLGNFERIGLIILASITTLFLIERTFWWYHHHRMETEEHPHLHTQKGQAYLLLMGDSIHNFVDGILIATAFLVSFPLGVSVAIGVIAHEVPQEIADFAVMLNAGFKRIKIIILNLLSASATLVGAVATYFLLDVTNNAIPYILSVASGVFIYVALSDLIPVIHHHSEHKYNAWHILFLIAGVVLIIIS